MKQLFGNNDFEKEKSVIDELLSKSWRFRNTKEFTRFFDFINRFHHYSRYNTMLVFIQNQAVTFFGGISYWSKEFKRTIKEDARPYIILAPKGPVMLVYDIFETEGELSPEEFLEAGLGRKPYEMFGVLEDNVLHYAIEEARKWGIKITYKPFSYFKAGHITTIFAGHLEICLKEGMSNEENFSVLIHELAHLFLGHTGHSKLNYQGRENYLKLLSRQLRYNAAELEAETVCYLICHKLGLESRSAEYIAGFIKREEDLQLFDYEVVIKIADKIERLFID